MTIGTELLLGVVTTPGGWLLGWCIGWCFREHRADEKKITAAPSRDIAAVMRRRPAWDGPMIAYQPPMKACAFCARHGRVYGSVERCLKCATYRPSVITADDKYIRCGALTAKYGTIDEPKRLVAWNGDVVRYKPGRQF